MTQFTVISPVDGRELMTRDYATWDEIAAAADAAEAIFPVWAAVPLDERAKIVRAAVDWLVAQADDIALDLAWSIGRPLHMADETPRLDVVTDQLIRDAEEAFKPIAFPSDGGITRYVKRAPRGLVLSICAWNYPVAMPANMIVAPLLAGDPVIFKHAPQTALVGDWFARAFQAVGLPEGVFQSIMMDHADVARLINEKPVSVIQFIGSTRGGIALREASAARPIELGLEMGGSDPAYVRADADLELAVAELVSGSFGNSGQSCCSVERIYVHADIHDRFLDAFADAAGKLVMGHPIEGKPDLGPVVSADAAARITGLIDDAVAAGAKPLLPVQTPPDVEDPSAYVSPQILAGTTHDMRIMREEIFGPVVSVMKVESDEEAIALMNDSRYALSASVWSGSAREAVEIGTCLRCGTFYHNKCDYADLYLPWGGVGWSGLGRINGGAIGYGKLTEMKSYVLPDGEG